MVLEKTTAKNNIDIVLWDFDYDTSHFYSVMAYPTAQKTDYENDFSARRGEKICIDISFENLESAKRGFTDLKDGVKAITDFTENIRNKELLKFI